MSPAPPRPRDGTVVGEVRAPIAQDRLLPYLEKEVEGFKGPLTIKQFGVSVASGPLVAADLQPCHRPWSHDRMPVTPTATTRTTSHIPR